MLKLYCLLFGHNWITTKSKKDSNGKITITQMKCKRCGKTYYEK